MARESMGKVLLRNVIRHTDAHNKIQEESEMWKMRDMEKTSCHKQISAMDGRRGHMHCDRMGSESRARSGSRERSSGRNEREARYWTRKLYEFEANDPDRWGHSGFKELYPEEFRIEGEGGAGDKSKHRKKKKSKCSSPTDKSKSSKKSSKKKKKKKEAKRKRERADRSGDEDKDEDSDTKRKRRTSSKSKPSKRRDKSRGKEESSSEDSGEEGAGEGRTQTHGKQQRNSDRGCQIGLEVHKKRRKNWKAPNEERSEGSSDE